MTYPDATIIKWRSVIFEKRQNERSGRSSFIFLITFEASTRPLSNHMRFKHRLNCIGCSETPWFLVGGLFSFPCYDFIDILSHILFKVLPCFPVFVYFILVIKLLTCFWLLCSLCFPHLFWFSAQPVCCSHSRLPCIYSLVFFTLSAHPPVTRHPACAPAILLLQFVFTVFVKLHQLVEWNLFLLSHLCSPLLNISRQVRAEHKVF